MVARNGSRLVNRVSRALFSEQTRTSVGITDGFHDSHRTPPAIRSPHLRTITSFIGRWSTDLDSRIPRMAFGEASLMSQSRHFHATGSLGMAKRDFYSVLGVNKSASDSDIKKAYYKLAKEHHPDANKGNSQSEAKFQEIQAAYEVLKDKSKRSTYDQVGAENWDRVDQGGGGGSGQSSEGFDWGNPFGSGEAFEEIFARSMGNQGRPAKQNIEAEMELTFREAIEGCIKRVTIPSSQTCKTCHGSGSPPGMKPVKCPGCKGRGTMRISQMGFLIETTCSQCGGKGSLRMQDCRSCGGDGQVLVDKEVDVKVPAGMDNGMTLRMSGQGGGGGRGVSPGDLFLYMKVQADPVFRREGQNIHTDVPITIAQAALGAQVHAATLSGSVLLRVKAGTQPGATNVLRGKGVRKPNGGGYGDQFVHYRVTVPMELTTRQRELLEEYMREDNEEGEEASATVG